MTITEREIVLSIKSLKRNKSSGSNEIFNGYIISTKHSRVMLPIYLLLFNTVLDTGHIPSNWFKGTIIKSSKIAPSNYRSITLVTCLGKLFASIINYRLSKYMKNGSIGGSIISE